MGFFSIDDWPAPADEGAGKRLAERFAGIGASEARFAKRLLGGTVLRSVGGGSDYLADLALREPAALRATLLLGPDRVVADAMHRLAHVAPGSPRRAIAAELRQAKRVVALATALADIGGAWALERVTGALSELAEATLSLAAAHLLLTAHDQGAIVLADRADPEASSGLIVLGMGKLGARELNFSSDIDLIVLFDPARSLARADGDGEAAREIAAGLTATYARLTRDLVSLMEGRDPDGFVFRTDLRLRPDPAATPPAIALPAAISYYESMGQNWERAAMIKARPVAGDRAGGMAFLEAIRPFVWRRGLDFAAVADIHAMKRRMDAHRGFGAGSATLTGFNVKLGPGGIREIEFLAQTLQLIWGGRDPGLRDPRTIPALAGLSRARHLPPDAVTELSEAYAFLRRVEHRLQMVADRQTHSLPSSADAFSKFSRFMGFATQAGFESELNAHLSRVRDWYGRVFDAVPSATSGGRHETGPPLDFDGDDPAPEDTVARLTELNFSDPKHVIASVRGWRAGRVRAMRSGRARDLMDRMLPALLGALARQRQPDVAFARADEFFSRLPAGVPILSMFERNPALLDRVASILGAAPALADHLTRFPSSLDGLLAPDSALQPADKIAASLADARTLEDSIALIRRIVREQDFFLSVATMEGRLEADEAGLRRATLADAALSALLPCVLADFSQRFGRVPSGEMAIVALGKTGGREMMAGSDLDLMLIYDHAADATDSVGGRPLAPGQWFVRAAHAYVAALTASGADGPLYEVDMRLRPSGNKGPVAVSIGSFRRYHATDAWTWERMALTRARVVCGAPDLVRATEAAIAVALDSAGEPARVQADAASMRARLDRELPSDGAWDVKHRVGGLIDVEFIAQALLLATPSARPGGTATRDQLRAVAKVGALAKDAEKELIAADHLWRTIQGVLRITVGRNAPEALPEASAAILLRATGAVNLSSLRATMDRVAAKTRAAFERHVRTKQ